MQFYIYVQCRPPTKKFPTGEPFYVGKGFCEGARRGRAYRFKPRNIYHGNVIKKHGANNCKVYIYYCRNENHALNICEPWMKKWCDAQGHRLTNMTECGEGSSGYRHTVESRIRMVRTANKDTSAANAAMAKLYKDPEFRVAQGRRIAAGQAKRSEEASRKLSLKLRVVQLRRRIRNDEDFSAALRKGWETRRKNSTTDFSAAGYKSWETRRRRNKCERNKNGTFKPAKEKR